jgi:hypothetical protein
MAVSALELRPRGAVALLDAGIRLCVRSAGVWALTLPGGALVTAAVLHLSDSILHGQGLLLPALWLTLAWMARGLFQGATCHHVQELLLGKTEPSARASLRAALARAPSLLVAVGYLFTFNALTFSATVGFSLFFLSAHLVGYAAILQGRGSPLGLYGLCSRLLGPARAGATGVRLLLLLAQLLVFINLHSVSALFFFVGRKLMGIDLTYAERFASLDSAPWVVFLAAVTFTLFEPLRASLATLLLVDGRVRQEGLDLLAAVEQLPVRATRAREGARSAALLLLVLGGTLLAAPAQADTPEAPLPHSQVAKRLSDLAEHCEYNEGAASQWAETVSALSPAEALKFQRLLRSVEQAVEEDEGCAALSRLQQGVTLAGQVVEREQADARATAERARDILARPEFAVAPPAAPKEDTDSLQTPGWWQEFLDKVNKLLEDLFKRDEEEARPGSPLFTPSSGQGAANALVIFLGGAVLLLLGVILVRALSKEGKEAEGDALEVSTQDAAALAADPTNALSRPPEGWAHLADELAARGEYREAVRSLYLALLSRLHRDGAILYDSTLSNWDYLRHFKGQREWLPPFRELTYRFDFAWYGNLPVGQEGYDTFRTLCAPLLAPRAPEAARA